MKKKDKFIIIFERLYTIIYSNITETFMTKAENRYILIKLIIHAINNSVLTLLIIIIIITYKCINM